MPKLDKRMLLEFAQRDKRGWQKSRRITLVSPVLNYFITFTRWQTHSFHVCDLINLIYVHLNFTFEVWSWICYAFDCIQPGPYLSLPGKVNKRLGFCHEYCKLRFKAFIKVITLWKIQNSNELYFIEEFYFIQNTFYISMAGLNVYVSF